MTDLTLADGRVLRVHDTGGPGDVVFWFHGTPNDGTPPAPLFRPGVRWIAYDRPGYGGSTPRPGRTVGSTATDAAAVADALGVDRFAVMGHSGGGPHGLAVAAALPDRVLAVVAASGLAPRDATGMDWWAGMGDTGRATLAAAIAGRAAMERFESPDPDFTPDDWAALDGEWSWFGPVVTAALANGRAPLIDDELAYVSPWGFDPATITAPMLLLYGTDDHVVPPSHGEWLANHCPTAELRLVPGAGHISVLHQGAEALTWLLDRATSSR